MKDLRIFVASSRELLPERNALAYFALKHEEKFEKRGFRVRLSKFAILSTSACLAEVNHKESEVQYGK